MKKVIHYFLIVISVGILINVVKIIIVNMNKFTNYTYGNILGNLIILFVFIVILIKTGNKKLKK